jgi:hypothetical protein
LLQLRLGSLQGPHQCCYRGGTPMEMWVWAQKRAGRRAT